MLKIKGMKLWINPSKMETAPAKYINHSCIPNCVNKMWGITCIGIVVACSDQQGYDQGSNPGAVQVPCRCTLLLTLPT